MSKEPKLVYMVDTSKIVKKDNNNLKRNEYKFIDYKDCYKRILEYENKHKK